MAQIIEESEKPGGQRIAIVRTERGRELHVNVDELVCRAAESFCNEANSTERKWLLNGPWFRDERHHLMRTISESKP